MLTEDEARDMTLFWGLCAMFVAIPDGPEVLPKVDGRTRSPSSIPLRTFGAALPGRLLESGPSRWLWSKNLRGMPAEGLQKG